MSQGRAMMSDQHDDAPSRRAVLAGGASLAAAPLLAGEARAQGVADPDLARIQGARRILFKGGVVLTLDRQVGDLAPGDVLVEDGKIRDVRPNISADDAVVADATNRILIPGFVDTHVHSYQGLLRTLLPNGLVDPDYNRDIQNNLTMVYEPADAHLGVLVTSLAQIDNGTTTMVDISQVAHTPEHSDANIAGLKEAGIRAVFAYSRGAGPKNQYPQDINRLLRTYFTSKDQLLTPAMATAV